MFIFCMALIYICTTVQKHTTSLSSIIKCWSMMKGYNINNICTHQKMNLTL